jgi:hypothetical protein
MKKPRSQVRDLRQARTHKIKSRQVRNLDDFGPDELLDDWMVSGPAVELPSE